MSVTKRQEHIDKQTHPEPLLNMENTNYTTRCDLKETKEKLIKMIEDIQARFPKHTQRESTPKGSSNLAIHYRRLDSTALTSTPIPDPIHTMKSDKEYNPPP
ncbi:hypothetical protein KFK09_008614 [Dendrobium nobile]|uniref:Uncharacterized protein n=1 Tax=Dendrobium nobile TaxID=94219 RepID=A0A8T3BRC0_DENNO|nr:hypothetical protein KFK09_008614 [Dendrobium nobile]